MTDRRGRVVAFGGRILKGDGVYQQPGITLFPQGPVALQLGADHEAAPRGAPVVVVEGYMDVIALVEAGFEAAVAPLGTALTEEQIVELWKLGGTAGDPILCFDGDTAGQRAAARAVERVLPGLGAGKSLRFAFCRTGRDPDNLIRREGTRAMRAVLEGAIPLVDVDLATRNGRPVLLTREIRAAVRRPRWRPTWFGLRTKPYRGITAPSSGPAGSGLGLDQISRRASRNSRFGLLRRGSRLAAPLFRRPRGSSGSAR